MHGVLCYADPFAKKDWYDIKAPTAFQVRSIGKTLVTRTQGTKVRSRRTATAPAPDVAAAGPCSSSSRLMSRFGGT